MTNRFFFFDWSWRLVSLILNQAHIPVMHSTWPVSTENFFDGILLKGFASVFISQTDFPCVWLYMSTHMTFFHVLKLGLFLTKLYMHTNCIYQHWIYSSSLPSVQATTYFEDWILMVFLIWKLKIQLEFKAGVTSRVFTDASFLVMVKCKLWNNDWIFYSVIFHMASRLCATLVKECW